MNKETLQEYNTRLAENNTSLDDILTTINNLPEGGSSGGSSDIYSLEETVIGTWLGKPLYRKVIDFGPLPDNASVTIEHNIIDLDKIVRLYGSAIREDKEILPIPYTVVNADNVGGILTYATATIINLRTSNNRSSYNAYMTLEYTKTTD